MIALCSSSLVPRFFLTLCALQMSDDPNKSLLREPVYDHKSPDARSEKFTKFLSLLTTYLGSLHATVGAMSVSLVVTGTFKLDSNNFEGEWYNLQSFYEANDLDIYADADKKKWAKIQWTLLHVLQKSFTDSDPALAQANDYTSVVKWHASEWGVSPDTDLSCDWVPFGTIFLARLYSAYVDQTGTDALVKILNHEQAKLRFHTITNLTNFIKWKQTLLARWKEVEALVSKYDASYLAGLQLLEVVKRHPAKRLSQTAHMFTEKHQNDAFSIEQLLDTLHNTFKHAHLETQGNNLYPPPPHVHSTAAPAAPVGGGGGNKHKDKKSGKKQCRNFAQCKGYPPALKYSLCRPCYAAKRTGLPIKAASNLIQKQASNMKKKFAKSKSQGNKAEVHKLQATLPNDDDIDELSFAHAAPNQAVKKAPGPHEPEVFSLVAHSNNSFPTLPLDRTALGNDAFDGAEIFTLDELGQFGNTATLKKRANLAVKRALKKPKAKSAGAEDRD